MTLVPIDGDDANVMRHALWQLLEMFFLQPDINEGYLPEVRAGLPGNLAGSLRCELGCRCR